MKIKEKFRNFVKWYIKGYYHCDKCPYSWEERGLEDVEAGCYIKGNICYTCRLIPPFKNIIGYFKKKKREKEYEEWEKEWEKEYEKWEEKGETESDI